MIDYDWSDPNDNLEAYVKLSNSLKDGDWVHGWYSGLVFGMFPNQTPDALFGLEGFGPGYTVRQDNGSYASYWKEVGFYKDLKTNQIIETWKNPYTGETNRVMHSGSWIRLAPWLPWMMMGQSEGRLFYRCTARSLADLSQLPPNISAYAEKNYAEYLTNELDEDQPSESSFEVYMKENEPAS